MQDLSFPTRDLNPCSGVLITGLSGKYPTLLIFNKDKNKVWEDSGILVEFSASKTPSTNLNTDFLNPKQFSTGVCCDTLYHHY